MFVLASPSAPVIYLFFRIVLSTRALQNVWLNHVRLALSYKGLANSVKASESARATELN